MNIKKRPVSEEASQAHNYIIEHISGNVNYEEFYNLLDKGKYLDRGDAYSLFKMIEEALGEPEFIPEDRLEGLKDLFFRGGWEDFMDAGINQLDYPDQDSYWEDYNITIQCRIEAFVKIGKTEF